MRRGALVVAFLCCARAAWGGPSRPAPRAGDTFFCPPPRAVRRELWRRPSACVRPDGQEAGAGPKTLAEAQALTGWREGDRFLFGYGALLSSDVWRVLPPSLGPFLSGLPLACM